MYATTSRTYAFDQRPKVVPVYGSKTKEFAVVATPSRLIQSSSRPLSRYGPAATDLINNPTRYSSYPSYSYEGEERYGRMNRGLRHFSMKVCEKVKQKGCTNYNEVADELVSEYFDSLNETPDPKFQSFDMKNIRRRVYDALNVLMAMNIIEKHNKEIRWNGLPTSAVQEIKILENERAKKEEKLKEKYEQCLDLMMQLVAYKNLIRRNRQREVETGVISSEDSVLFLPFLIVAADAGTEVECSIAADKSEYVFQFDRPFEMFDDVEALKRLTLTGGLDSQANFPLEVRQRTKQHMPPELRPFVDEVIDEVEQSRQLERTQALREAMKANNYYSIVRPSSLSRVGGVSMRSAASKPPQTSMGYSSRLHMPMVKLESYGGQEEAPVLQEQHAEENLFRPVVLKKEAGYAPVYYKDVVVSGDMVVENGMELDEYGEVIYEDVGATEEIAYE